MLQRLSIQNYALIDSLEITFQDGLNIITGETGAGKSILLGALSMILGQRADSSSLLDSSRKSIVEGEFLMGKSQISISDFFAEHELDLENTILLRREISAEGKSRAFINDTPVNLQQLRELGSILIDIHSQHETLLLNKSDFQRSTLDAFAGITSEVEEYNSQYKTYIKSLKLLDELLEQEQKAKSDQDYFQFQFSELEEACLISGEQEKLEEELQSLTHAEEISSGLSEIEQLISGADQNLLHGVHQLTIQIQHLTKFHPKLNTIAERVKSTEIELKDIADELTSVASEVVIDPARVEIVTERLNLIYRLQQKHRVNTIDGLNELQETINQKLAGIGSLQNQIVQLEDDCTKKKNKLLKLADKLSERRNKTIPELEQNIRKLLKEVGMPNAVLKIENEQLDSGNIGPSGKDSIKFLFSANKGVAYSDISKVASGGELSRLMLCIKSSVAKLIQLPSLIFDEIDTGVSGETAFQIGNLMKQMSSKHQLIVITHLPQIAGRGQNHFFVYKEVLSKRTFTRVKLLDQNERITEVARMLSGDKPTAIAMANARELMKV
ncbi:MAG: DNA repair protein RecN [Bacteroidetes bacterium]|nr:MAG: DNA repair protein RecN [Bacteroidota bacterium]